MTREPAERVTPYFRSELEDLMARLVTLGGLAEQRLREAADGLIERDAARLDRVIAGDAPLDELHIEIDGRCLRLLALYQPMATDLRAIVAAVKINAELERVGDLAVNVAEAARRYVQRLPFREVAGLTPMAATAQRMVRDALDAFVNQDVELARSVLAADEGLDRLRVEVFEDVVATMRRHPETIEPSLDLLLVSRHLERVGDHATNIAEDVIFMVSATDVRAPAAGVRREAETQ